MQSATYCLGTSQYEIACESALGTRAEQQDSYYINQNDHSVLAIVCDGMGGLSNGQRASLIAACQLGNLHKLKSSAVPFPDFFLNASDVLDETIHAFSNVDGERAGTTLVAVALQGNFLYWLSCGDSRLYIIRKKEIVQVTRDHNYKLTMDELLRQGKITATKYEQDLCRSEALISYIGMGGIELLDRNEEPLILQDSDLLLLMSDGLYRCISDQDMLCAATKGEHVGAIVAQLLELAERNALGIQDNTTIVAVRYRRNEI